MTIKKWWLPIMISARGLLIAVFFLSNHLCSYCTKWLLVISVGINRPNNNLVEISKRIVALTGKKMNYLITFLGRTLEPVPHILAKFDCYAGNIWKCRLYITPQSHIPSFATFKDICDFPEPSDNTWENEIF